MQDAKFLKELNASTAPYHLVLQVAKDARALAEKYDNRISHSEAITHVINGTLPDSSDLTARRNEHEAKVIREKFCYIEDKEVCDAVYDSFYESKWSKNLIYLYNGISDPSRQSRVRILTRMLIKELDITMEETKKVRKPRAKKSETAKKKNTAVTEEARHETASKNDTVKETSLSTKHVRLYKTSVAKTPFGTYAGEFYWWHDEHGNVLEQYDRRPITKNKDSKGNVLDIIGWVNLSEVK